MNYGRDEEIMERKRDVTREWDRIYPEATVEEERPKKIHRDESYTAELERQERERGMAGIDGVQ